MSKAWELYNDSYIKGMKRPEYWGFEPDQASGSSMLFRSEQTNPWANRDQSNAKFGPQGRSAGVIQSSSPGGMSAGGIGGAATQLGLIPSNWNIPGVPSKSQSSFTDLMTPVAGAAGKYVGNNMADWFKGSSPTMADLSNKIGLLGGGETNLTDFASRMAGIGDKGLEGITSQSGDAIQGISDLMTKGSTEGLSDAISGAAGAGTDLASMGSSMGLAAVPQLAKMFGLKGTAGDAVEAAASVGGAVAQGGMNPIADLGALYSMYKLFKGFF